MTEVEWHQFRILIFLNLFLTRLLISRYSPAVFCKYHWPILLSSSSSLIPYISSLSKNTFSISSFSIRGQGNSIMFYGHNHSILHSNRAHRFLKPGSGYSQISWSKECSLNAGVRLHLYALLAHQYDFWIDWLEMWSTNRYFNYLLANFSRLPLTLPREIQTVSKANVSPAANKSCLLLLKSNFEAILP